METVSFAPTKDFLEIANKVFTQERERILSVLPNAEVHHIGSTAIPGAITKGDLDVNIRVKEGEFKGAVEQLKKLYAISQPYNWTEHFASFKSGDLEIDFGVQLTAIDTKDDTFLLFRDTLIKNPTLVEEYNELKVRFEGGSMDEYRKEKSKFCEKVVGRE